MRDLTRLREKREFSLDDRQVVALAVCAVLLLAGVFALGVTLGKRLSAPPPPPAELAQLDQAAKPSPAVVPNQPTPPQEQLPPPTPAEEKPAPKSEVGGIGDTNRGSAAHHVPDRARAIPAPQRAAMVVAPPPRPLQVASPAPVALTPPPKDVGKFTVQVGASQDRAEAHKLESRARAAGLKPYVVEADLGSRGTWYRVRVGAFSDKDAANRFRKDVERELRAPAVVMATR